MTPIVLTKENAFIDVNINLSIGLTNFCVIEANLLKKPAQFNEQQKPSPFQVYFLNKKQITKWLENISQKVESTLKWNMFGLCLTKLAPVDIPAFLIPKNLQSAPNSEMDIEIFFMFHCLIVFKVVLLEKLGNRLQFKQNWNNYRYRLRSQGIVISQIGLMWTIIDIFQHVKSLADINTSLAYVHINEKNKNRQSIFIK
ncbi:hypothetical protein RFI_23736 [Reticulomyxa filosa]|uniref:Uncharacterized protein n=1 Tax=Reticulomyxa filosa TaxID=46433 RepID=X6MIY3_RETFI|nr:hypothetical protein RFI_23736 [Reticulomyxa filosa]|eukprot:ETO13636.1 hypothetical protein RFI_23736 [Reticulomyxa filosa]